MKHLTKAPSIISTSKLRMGWEDHKLLEMKLTEKEIQNHFSDSVNPLD
jgi:hypothetical protein